MNPYYKSRRTAIKTIGLTGLGLLSNQFLSSFTFEKKMSARKIPSTGELLPMIGLGTWLTFDVGNSNAAKTPLKEVLKKMNTLGGKMIDSSPMYGSSESVVGELTHDTKLENQFFYATKVWTSGEQSGIRQMNESMKKMKRKTMDLMQIHNLVDWKTHLKTLKRWKEEGKIKYIGITHYTVGAHDNLEKVIKSQDIDFVQFNYSIRVRNAEKSLLNTAADNGVAVIINRPYEGGSLFRMVKGSKLPDWCVEYDIKSWGQFFLKYILSHEAVNCVIPGTSKPHHVVDNMQAGYGHFPDTKGREKMRNFIENI